MPTKSKKYRVEDSAVDTYILSLYSYLRDTSADLLGSFPEATKGQLLYDAVVRRKGWAPAPYDYSLAYGSGGIFVRPDDTLNNVFYLVAIRELEEVYKAKRFTKEQVEGLIKMFRGRAPHILQAIADGTIPDRPSFPKKHGIDFGYSGYLYEELQIAAALRAYEWHLWPAFLSMGFGTILLLVLPPFAALGLVIVANLAWSLVVPKLFVSERAATLGMYAQRAAIWIITPLVSLHFLLTGNYPVALLAILWPLLSMAISKFAFRTPYGTTEARMLEQMEGSRERELDPLLKL